AGRFATAEDVFTRSAAACTKGNDPECVAHATVGTAFEQSLQQHHVQAVATYRRAIALFTTLKKREDAARAEIGLSQALTGSGEYVSALAAARHAQREGTAIGVDDVVWRALVACARAERRSMNATAAMVDAKEAVSRVDMLAERAIDGLNDQPSADSTGAYALLAVLQAEANDAAGAFATLERRRAHALRLELARNERDIVRGMTQAERDGERQSAAEVATVRAQLDHERALPKPDAARIERLQQRLSAAAQQRSTDRTAVFARVPELPVWRGLQPAIMLTDTVSHLSDGEVLAEFAIDDDDLIVVIVSRRGDEPSCRAYVSSVPRQTLAERIAHAVDPAVLRDLSQWKSAATDFVNAMSTSAFAVMAASTRIVLVPDDVLWRIPFEALPIDNGFLGDRTTIVYAGSATSLYTLPPVPAAAATPPVLAIASPDVPAATRDRLQAIAIDRPHCCPI
ncbi:MAG: CHAT domain-containing protein, partial [Acidobacteria bacterium]|nr:CHAT domain-containing protein [Acidobacteriota bacterium]